MNIPLLTEQMKSRFVDAEHFNFDGGNSLFLTGQSGCGKSFLRDKIIEKLVDNHTSDELQFVLFDMTQVDFDALKANHKEYIAHHVVGMEGNKPFELLEQMAKLAEERTRSGVTEPQLFIIIEECDLAFLDQKRFDQAVMTINKNAKLANMKLIYSTSRLSPDVISKDLLQTFDIILAGQLASEEDSKYLGIPYQEKIEQFRFVVA